MCDIGLEIFPEVQKEILVDEHQVRTPYLPDFIQRTSLNIPSTKIFAFL